MNRPSRSRLVGLLVPLALWAAPSSAQSTQFSLGLGYQWVDVSGSEDMYRSQVNERSGATLESFSLTTTDTSGDRFFDRLHIDASSLGASPQGRFHLDIGLAHRYDVRIDYYRAKHYSALPAFANPLLGSGIVPGEHTLDRTFDTLDVNVAILPDGVVTPLIGYTRYHMWGPGRTTYHVGEDEFRVNSDADETSNEYRAGVTVRLPNFDATVIQAWRSFDATDTLVLADGAGDGNNSRPVLGHDVSLSVLTSRSHSEGSYPITTGSFSGRIGDWTRVTGTYVRTNFSSDGSQADSLSGDLVSFDLSRFFGGLTESGRSKAKALDWRGDVTVEVEPTDGVTIAAGYTSKHRELDGWSVISSLYTSAATFNNVGTADISKVLAADTAVERDEDVFEAKASTRNLGPVKVWAAWAKVDQDTKVTPDAAEIVVPGGQGGTFDREMTRYSAGATLTVASIKLGADWRKDDADSTVLRTDYLDQKRWRFRADWTAGKLLRLLGTAEKLTADNPSAGVDYSLDTKHYAIDAELTPIQPLSLRLGYGSYKTSSDITIRRPETFVLEGAPYSEDGKEKSASVTFKQGRIAVDAGVSRFENTGSLGLKLDRTYARLDVEITSEIGASVEYDQRKYEETLLSLDNYDAKRYGVFLHWQK